MSVVTPETLLAIGGRLHPVVLHLPIGIAVGLLGVESVALLLRRPLPSHVRRTLVLLLAAGAIASAASGLLLARADALGGTTLERHRNLGIAATIFTIIALVAAFRAPTRRSVAAYAAALVLVAGLLVPTGHLGGELTHGAGFLTAPLRAAASTPTQPVEPGDRFAAEIQPFLDRYCIECHSESRPKGRLTLVGLDAIERGGRAGPAIVAGDPAASLLLRRMHLPLEDDDHMPPADRPQPSAEEIATIERWIAERAPATAATPEAALPPPSREAIERLLAERIHVEVLDPATGELWIDVAAARDRPAAELLALIAPLGAHIADLSLAGTDLDDAVALPALPRLVRLDASGTTIGAVALARLADAPALATLLLHRVPLDAEAVDAIASLRSLRRLAVAESGLDAKTLARLRSALPECAVLADEPIAVEATALDDPNAAKPAGTLTPTNTHCPVTGAPVDPRYVIVRDGVAIGLCCPNCAARAWEAP